MKVSSDHSNKNMPSIWLLLYRKFPVFQNKFRIKSNFYYFYDLKIATHLPTTREAKQCVFYTSMKMSQIPSTSSEQSKAQHVLLHRGRVSSRYLGLELVAMQVTRVLNSTLRPLHSAAHGTSWLLGSASLFPK